MVEEREHLLPKEQNLIHVSSCIQRLKPISQKSTLQFESTYQQIKCGVNIGNNRVNIGYTASTKYKLRFSLLSLRNFNANVLDFIPSPDNFIPIKNRKLPQGRNIIDRYVKHAQYQIESL
uniref:Uncharacterized protein n=1 Tax=Strongyloides venezuelensis TaxID=75913 RepID=A0A0K0FEF3_STRVS